MRTLAVAALAALLFGAPATAAPEPDPAPPFAASADAMLANLARADRFSGVVLVARDGKPVFRKAYGLANREWNVAATPDTRFRTGSITKQFTAAAVLQLAEQGRLGLDDPIAKAYPAAPPAWSAVTLRHLLTHTSGIPNYTASSTGFFASPAGRVDRTPDQVIALVRDKPLEFQPGSRFSYDNTGYVLLGRVIEAVSGQDYEAYLQAHIFRPAGLKNTGFDHAETVLPRRAAGYALAGGPTGNHVQNASYVSMSLAYAAGGLYSTADDLLAWDTALRAGKVISPASVRAMFTDYGFRYGFGQYVETRDDKPFWHHGGSINGFQGMLARFPDQGLTLVVLSNETFSDPTGIAARLGDLWFHPAYGAGPAGPPSPAELAGYVGRYRLTEAITLDVTQEGGRLFVKPASLPRAELQRVVGRTFVGPPIVGYLRFPTGAPAREVVVMRGGPDMVAPRIP